MKDVGTLQELGLKVGDVVKVVGTVSQGECIENGGEWIIHSNFNNVFRGVKPEYNKDHAGIKLSSDFNLWIVVSRANTPKLWRDMTPGEKGALLLAAHEGKVIEFCRPETMPWWRLTTIPDKPRWRDGNAYRVKPELKVDVVKSYWCKKWGMRLRYPSHDTTHQITFNLIDGKPDCESVKMEVI